MIYIKPGINNRHKFNLLKYNVRYNHIQYSPSPRHFKTLEAAFQQSQRVNTKLELLINAMIKIPIPGDQTLEHFYLLFYNFDSLSNLTL